jgi:hypothetical protein
MDNKDKIAVIEELDHWQGILQRVLWDCIHQIDDTKCRLDSDFPGQVNLSGLKIQLQQLVDEVVKALDRR